MSAPTRFGAIYLPVRGPLKTGGKVDGSALVMLAVSAYFAARGARVSKTLDLGEAKAASLSQKQLAVAVSRPKSGFIVVIASEPRPDLALAAHLATEFSLEILSLRIDGDDGEIVGMGVDGARVIAMGKRAVRSKAKSSKLPHFEQSISFALEDALSDKKRKSFEAIHLRGLDAECYGMPSAAGPLPHVLPESGRKSRTKARAYST